MPIRFVEKQRVSKDVGRWLKARKLTVTTERAGELLAALSS